MIDLSVCLAAIRPQYWKRLYDSIVASLEGRYSFELILCSPEKKLPVELLGKENIQLIQSFASPSVANQIAALSAKGTYIKWSADDGWYLPGKLANALDLLNKSTNPKRVWLGRYNEGQAVYGNDYFYLNRHEQTRSPHIPESYVLCNMVVLCTEYFKELGGFDCQFEVTPITHLDFGVRLQRDGCELITEWDCVFGCDQQPGPIAEHAAVHYSQLEHDEPLYRQIYNDPNCVNRIKIDPYNYKSQPNVWQRRFGN